MTRSQEYSKLVFNRIQGIDDPTSETARRYKSLCKRSGGILRTVGLVQFMTFIVAKNKKGENHYGLLADHLLEEMVELGILEKNNDLGSLELIRAMHLSAYMRTTQTVLQLLQWHKRIAEILIRGDADDPEEAE